jgi:hypothetical protein
MSIIDQSLSEKANKDGELYELIKNLNNEGYSQLEITSSLFQYIETIFVEMTMEEEDDIMSILDTMEHWGNIRYWIFFNKPWTKEDAGNFYRQSKIQWGGKRG